MSKLAVNIAMVHPETGAIAMFEAGQEPPAWAVSLITNPDVWDGDAPAAPVEADPPPRGGPGSSKAAWVAYAAERGVVVEADSERDEIIAALEAANVPTE